MSFKIIAIRPLNNCNKKFLKNLKKNIFYTLYKDYSITQDNDENVIDIKYKPTIPQNLYYKNNIEINISAIVGKNGSGKSSIVELLYATLYNLSVNSRFIVNSPKEQKQSFNFTNYDFKNLESNLKNYNFKKPHKKYIENIDIDIDSLESLKSDIEMELKNSGKKVSFQKYTFLKTYTDIIENYNNELWHETSINKIDLQIQEFKKFKFDLERHFKINNDDYEEIVKCLEKINVQIVFESEGEIYVLHSKGTETKIFSLASSEEDDIIHYSIDIRTNPRDIFHKMKNERKLFYNIVNNYSLYGLNSLEIGNWITRIFHKNDGYQTPIVINPMRTEGNIDVNTENYLSKSRLLSNILSKVEDDDIKNSLRCLVNGKVVEKIILTLNEDKFKNSRGKIELKHLRHKDLLLHKILNAFKNTDDENYSETDIITKFSDLNLVQQFTIEYIFRKIEKIARTYKLNNNKFGEKFNFDYPFLLDKLLEDLKNDYSHITFKLRQAINFLKYDYKSIDKLKTKIEIPVSELSKEITKNIDQLKEKDYANARKEHELNDNSLSTENISKEDENRFMYINRLKHDLINFLPPSFYKIDLEFGENNGSFSDLSSGEKQHIFSISSIIYHLINLKSIESTGQVKYDYYNLIFDEIELYFHPDFQKTYISDLLTSITRTGMPFRGINIIFVTHSPFILSDIPPVNILFLENGTPSIRNDFRTFGANIHDLLADSFFMSNGYMGKFAEQKIDDTIKWLYENYEALKKFENNDPYQIEYIISNNELDRIKHKEIIDLIDEPILKKKLLEMYYHIFSIETEKERQIKEIIEQAKYLGLEIINPKM